MAAPLVGGRSVSWDDALDEAGAKLRAVIEGAGGAKSLGVVFNARSTNEDLHALARLAFEHLGIERAYLAGRDQGWHDDILVDADKNPNSAGARAIGGGKLRTLVDLANDLKQKNLAGLLVLGEDGVLGAGGLASLPVDTLPSLVVLASADDPLAAAAHVVLPLAMWAEVDGTFTNKQGRVQRIRRAVAPAGDSLPGWEILSHLARRLSAAMDFTSAKVVFEEARAKHPFMKGAEWGRTMLPVQMRFAASRG